MSLFGHFCLLKDIERKKGRKGDAYLLGLNGEKSVTFSDEREGGREKEVKRGWDRVRKIDELVYE